MYLKLKNTYTHSYVYIALYKMHISHKSDIYSKKKKKTDFLLQLYNYKFFHKNLSSFKFKTNIYLINKQTNT